MVVFAALDFLLWLYMIALVGRIVLSYVQMLARGWRPRGVLLVAAEGIYTVTDPPIKAVGKVVPPLRLGAIQLDLAFMIVFFAVVLLRGVLPG